MIYITVTGVIFRRRNASYLRPGSRLFHCIESVITLCARAPEKVILNLPSNGSDTSG